MIEIKNLSFDYGKRKRLFADFSLEMGNGQIVGLLGKNGAGKSTLLKLIAGLLAPQQGCLKVIGYRPFDRNPDFLTDIYMIPEEFSLPPTSISMYLKALVPLYRSFDREKLARIMEEFELSPKDQLHRLSHGQRKKFLIAMALASNCKLLLLDEPTNGLDIPSKSQFRKTVVSSISEEQLVLISTHQVKDIDTIIDRIVVVDGGAIIYQDDITAIGRNYLFETVPSFGDEKEIIYREKSPMGYRIIRPARGGEETTIDLELLFSAIVERKVNEKMSKQVNERNMKSNKFFSIKRFVRFFRADLLLNKKRYFYGAAIAWIGFYLIIVWSMSHYSRTYDSWAYMDPFALCLLGLAAAVGSAFPELSGKVKIDDYLLLPASAFEKLLTRFSLYVVIGSLLFLTLFWIDAHLARWTMMHTEAVRSGEKVIEVFRFSSFFGMEPKQPYQTLLVMAFCTIGVFLFVVRLFFRRFALVKSAIAFVAVFFSLLCGLSGFSHLFYPEKTSGFSVEIEFYQTSWGIQNIEVFFFAILSFSLLFLLPLAYFKLKEKEV